MGEGDHAAKRAAKAVPGLWPAAVAARGVHNPRLAEDERAQVRSKSQGGPKFLRSVVAEMVGADVVLADGSHINRYREPPLLTLTGDVTS